VRVIAASRDLWPTPNVASAVLAIMVSTDDAFGVRVDREGKAASSVEELVLKIADRINRPVIPYKAGGRLGSGNWARDVEMMKHSQRLYAFFSPGKFMMGGTAHLVQCALREGLPVEAYELDSHGMVVDAASDEGDLLSLIKKETAR